MAIILSRKRIRLLKALRLIRQAVRKARIPVRVVDEAVQATRQRSRL
jgi:hypothetical protein